MISLRRVILGQEVVPNEKCEIWRTIEVEAAEESDMGIGAKVLKIYLFYWWYPGMARVEFY